MLIALLALLGVDLGVIVVVGASALGRKRWVKQQPGAFRGVIRIADGKVEGLRAKWGRGYGRWVGNVLVWTKAPLLFRNELVVVDGLEEQRQADGDGVKRLGAHPALIRLTAGDAKVEVAAHADDSGRLLGPYDDRDAPAVDPKSLSVGST
jgi:hypothetical protein